MIFRNDDISVNTNLEELIDIYNIILEFFPSAEIWSCITLFAQMNNNGSVYKNTPFKNNEIRWFYDKADDVLGSRIMPQLYTIASHGLYHVDHSKLHKHAQEMSILGSCGFLKSKIFVPPFNKYNKDTMDICFDNNIQMIPEGWKNLENEEFDSRFQRWYFHGWRLTAKELREKLSADVAKVNC